MQTNEWIAKGKAKKKKWNERMREWKKGRMNMTKERKWKSVCSTVLNKTWCSVCA